MAEQQYRKKGDGDKPKYQEKQTPGTEDAYRPPTRGGRGGRGGERREGEERPATANRGRGGRGQRGGQDNRGEDRGDYKTRGNTRGGDRGGDRGGPRGRGERGGYRGNQKEGEGGNMMRGARKPLDENSWQFKFQNAERPQFEKIEVKIDTVLEALPSREETLKEPSRDKFNDEMRDLDKKAEELKITVEEAKYKRRQVYEGGKVEGENVTYKEVISERIEEVKKFRTDKKQHLDKMNVLKDRQREIETQKQSYQQNIPRNYHTSDDVNQAIKAKKKLYETTSMSSQEEKRLLKEIENLQKSLPDMQKLSELEPELRKIKDEKKKIQNELDIVKKFIEEKEEKIQDVKHKSQDQFDKRSEVREAAEKFTVVIDKSNEQISEIYKQKDELREHFYKNRYEHEIQSQKIKFIRGQMYEQRKLTDIVQNKNEKREKIKGEIAKMDNPKAREIETCDNLIGYCNKMKVQLGLAAPTSEEVAKKTETEMINEYNKTDLDSKIKDGKIVASVPKKEELYTQNKGKKGKKPKAAKTAETNGTLKVDLVIIQKFGMVGISPPVDGSVLDEKIEELKKRIITLGEEGQKELKQAKQDIEDNLDIAVEEALDRERKANEEDEYGEEEKRDDGRRNYRGRGGGRFGGDRDRSPPKKDDGGYFGAKFGKKKPRGEFEGSDDDGELDSFQSAYSKPSRGGGQVAGRTNIKAKRGGKAAMVINEDDFPTL